MIRRLARYGLLVGVATLCVPGEALAVQSDPTVNTQAAVSTVRHFATDQIRYEYKKSCSLLTPAFRRKEIRSGDNAAGPSPLTLPCSWFADGPANAINVLGVTWNGVDLKPSSAALAVVTAGSQVTTLADGRVRVTANNGGPILQYTLSPQQDGSYKISGFNRRWTGLSIAAQKQFALNNQLVTEFEQYYGSVFTHKGHAGPFKLYGRSSELLAGSALLTRARKLAPQDHLTIAGAPNTDATPGTIYLGHSTAGRLVVVSYDSAGDRFESDLWLSDFGSNKTSPKILVSADPGGDWPAVNAAAY